MRNLIFCGASKIISVYLFFCVALFGVALHANAATVYTDLASYQAAIGHTVNPLDTYDAFTQFTIEASPVDRGEYRIEDPDGSVIFSGGAQLNNVDGTGYLTLGSSDMLTSIFDTPIHSFAIEHRTQSHDVQIVNISGLGFNEDMLVTETAGFIGIVFDALVHRVTITHNGAEGAPFSVGLDNLRITGPEPATVPSPGIFFPMLLGLAGLMTMKRGLNNRTFKYLT